MAFKDFLLLALVCMIWGLNLVFTRYVVLEAPPLFYAFLRFAGIALVLAMFLRPIPRPFSTVALVGVCIGGLNFVLLFMALKHGTASEVAIASLVGLPFTTLLSVLMLGEKVFWRRGLGMALAFLGVLIIAYDPTGLSFSLGVVLGVLAALAGSYGGVLMKKMNPVGMYNLQAWVAMVSWPLVLPLTALMEENHIGATVAVGWPALGALTFSIFAVSIFGHGQFYKLLQRYEVTQLTPLTLMTPIWAVVFGALLLKEPITAKLVAGGSIAILGVLIIAVRPNLRLPDAGAWWERWRS